MDPRAQPPTEAPAESGRPPSGPRWRIELLGSLRAALAWSYQLLAPTEASPTRKGAASPLQRFFARLSVFRGGWTEAAAEAVCLDREWEEGQTALDYLQQLRECSLILAEEAPAPSEPGSGHGPRGGRSTSAVPETRFRMVGTLREFADEQLAPAERAELERRHAEYSLALAREGQPDLRTPVRVEWLDRLEQEHDNLRAAIDGSIASGDAERALQLGEAIWPLWSERGYLAEGRERLAAILALPATAGSWLERARVLRGAGLLACQQGDTAAARPYMEESLEILRQYVDRHEIARTCVSLGFLETTCRNLPEARALCEESLAAGQQVDDRLATAACLHTLGSILSDLGEFEAAREHLSRSLALYRSVNHRVAAATVLAEQGWLAVAQDDPTAAREGFQESLEIFRALGDRQSEAKCLLGLGDVHRWLGNRDRACARFGQALALYRALENRAGAAQTLYNLGWLSHDQGDLDSAAACFGESLALYREIGDRTAVGLDLDALAFVERALNHPRRAVRLFANSGSVLDAAGFRLWPRHQGGRDARIAALREALGEPDFAAAWAEGQAMSWEDAAAYALGELRLPEDEVPGSELQPAEDEAPRTAPSQELTDAQWEAIRPLLPATGRHGRPRADDRRTLDGILYVLRTGCGWRQMPRRYGSWSTGARRLSERRADGTWERVEQALVKCRHPVSETDSAF